jgi:hypothetical protein
VTFPTAAIVVGKCLVRKQRFVTQTPQSARGRDGGAWAAGSAVEAERSCRLQPRPARLHTAQPLLHASLPRLSQPPSRPQPCATHPPTLLLCTTTLSCRCQRTARASTTRSRSRPLRTMSGTASRWLTWLTSWAMMGPQSRSACVCGGGGGGALVLHKAGASEGACQASGVDKEERA